MKRLVRLSELDSWEDVDFRDAKNIALYDISSLLTMGDGLVAEAATGSINRGLVESCPCGDCSIRRMGGRLHSLANREEYRGAIKFVSIKSHGDHHDRNESTDDSKE